MKSPVHRMSTTLPAYRLPLTALPGVIGSVLWRRQRSFAHDAMRAMATVRPAPLVFGTGNIPLDGPALIVCNHYVRPGLGNWWVPLSISATAAVHRARGADREVHWVITAEWRLPRGDPRRSLVSPATRWAFRRLAFAYDFVSMPPMPPEPEDMQARTVAVRQALRLARCLAPAGGMIGLSPEGRDNPSGGTRLGELPPGAGEFVALLTAAGLPLLPCGVGEADGRLVLSFGPPFFPDVPPRRQDRDRAVGAEVLSAIAEQLTGLQS